MNVMSLVLLVGLLIGVLFVPILTILEGILILIVWRRSERLWKRLIAWFGFISPIVIIILLLVALSLYFIDLNQYDNSFIHSLILLSLIYLLLIFEGLLIYFAWHKNESTMKQIIARLGLLLPLPLTTYSYFSILLIFFANN